jgi:2-polyprenyl-3-methyl-5-hydroxy-6-metoxy-1,4-benzoquinol methylase
MACCEPGAYARWFGAQTAQRNAARYRRRGLKRLATRIVDLVTARDVDGATVLEIGGGIGDLQIELLRAGATRAVSVELSPAYEQVARELVRETSFGGRVEWVTADVARDPDAVELADIVVMNSVVCCYPDMEPLMEVAARKARRLLVVTYPRSLWYLHAYAAVANVGTRRLVHGFRFYVHPPDAIIATAEATGLRVAERPHGWVDEIAVLERLPDREGSAR